MTTWFFTLEPLNPGNPSLLSDLINLVDGKLPSRFQTYVGNRRVKVLPGPDLPKRIRLAHAVSQFRHQTNDSTVVSRTDVDGWIDVDRLKAYESLEIELREEIFAVGILLERSLRRPAFEQRLARFTPMEFMECILDVMPVLVQTGRFEDAVNNGCPLFTDDRVEQILKIFELADPQSGQATDVLDIRFSTDGSVKWGAKVIRTRSDADALKAGMTTPKKLLSTYKLCRNHLVQALILRYLHQGTTLVEFRQEVGNLVKWSTLPFYPKAQLDRGLSLDEFKAKAREFDTQNPTRWQAYSTMLGTQLDRAATSTGSILGIIDLYLAAEKVVSEDEVTETSLKNLVVAGFGVMDDGLGRLGAAAPALLGEMGEGLKTLTSSLSKTFIARALFVFAIVDVVVKTRTVSTTRAEKVGNAMMLAGGVIGVGASGMGLLASAGVISVAAAPVVVAALVSAALGLVGWAVIAVFHETYTEQILAGCFFRKDASKWQEVLDADNVASDLRAAFVERRDGAEIEHLSNQIAYAVGLVRGFAPSAKNETILTRKVEYKIARTPNAPNPPTSEADVDFALSIKLYNMEFEHPMAQVSSLEQTIVTKLFNDFENPLRIGTVGDKKPPLEFELRTVFKDEPLTLEPISQQVRRWLAANVVTAGGSPPDWAPGPREHLKIRERVKAD